MELLIKGGIFVYLILVFSIFSIGIFFEKLWTLRRSKVIPDNFILAIEGLIKNGDLEKSIELCKRDGSAIANIVLVAINNIGKGENTIKELVEAAGKQEIAKLGRYEEAISAVAATTPLLGLLGTVFGIIKAFKVIAVGGVGNPSLLAVGISEALFATASGLGAAVISFIAYKYIDGVLTKLSIALEADAVKILSVMPVKNKEIMP
ncbi:MAG: MotA/TolQ/ExbB proton channel family protein [Deltaproteobacteria bacterium]|nr:MotA/TolQ/ExbB proton channel family protein [Deltaproteobacteria bacterium]MCL5791593.1 MotA/TolQ/ExbB proton channel family protein [Deltaproteobacteria bacterium]